MRTDNSENFRLARLDQIRREQEQRASRLRELHGEIQTQEALELTLMQRLLRAQHFNPNVGVCPRCAIDDGEPVELNPIPVATIVIDNVAEDVDLMRCPRCAWDDTIMN